MGQRTRWRDSPPEVSRNRVNCPFFLLRIRSKLESISGNSAAKRTKKNRQEIGARVYRKILQSAEMPEGFQRVEWHMKRNTYIDRRRSRGGLGVNCDRSRASLKGGVKQVYVRQDDDHQHDKHHAAQDDQA